MIRIAAAKSRPRAVRPSVRGGKSVGYILFETMVAMVLLSVGLIAINRAMRETIVVRGQARDYTEARFLIEETISMLELQPQLVEASKSGRFKGEHSRFSYKWQVSKVDVPEPELPSDTPPEGAEKFKLAARYLAKIEATVSWERFGRKYEQTAQTLWTPEKLFMPEEERTP
jgi:Tfp pilus assembly protein PilV